MFPLLPRLSLLLACLVLAGTGLLPTTTAENEDCRSPPREEDFKHPLKEDFYLYLPEGDEDRSKFGWWQNVNHRPGLQTEGCSVDDIVVYTADKQTDVLLP